MAQVIASKMSVFEYILACINDILTRENKPEVIEGAIDDRIKAGLTYFSELAPWFVLSHSEYSWNLFFSDYLVVIITYQEFLETNYNYEGATEILDQLQPIIRLAEIGAGYEELIRAGNMVIAEIKLWKEISPPALTLSKSYLESLGYYDSEIENQQAGECQ